jgi:NAD(P)-dependent dehydrogenase (short-subunit alcohol dehydrogenase family)
MPRPIEEQTILITGSTNGLGLATARRLADMGATVLVHGRDEARVHSTVQDFYPDTAADTAADAAGTDRLAYVADLSSLSEVRRLAEEVRSDHEQLHVLVNNAGIALSSRDRQLSADGYELTFAVNYLSHFLLTRLLLHLLESSAPARIVNVASIGQAPIDFDDLMLERGYEPFRAYAQSKLAQIMYTFELAERLGDDSGATVDALHPATLMDTNMVRQTFGRAMTSVEEGVEAALPLICSDDLEGVTGRYFDGTRESTADPQADDRDARRRLWELSERLCGL